MFLLTVIKIVHISALFLIPVYLEIILNERVFQKIKFRIFEVLLYIHVVIYDKYSPKPLDLES